MQLQLHVEPTGICERMGFDKNKQRPYFPVILWRTNGKLLHHSVTPVSVAATCLPVPATNHAMRASYLEVTHLSTQNQLYTKSSIFSVSTYLHYLLGPQQISAHLDCHSTSSKHTLSVRKTFEENQTKTDRLVLNENIACKYQWHCPRVCH